MRNLGLILIIIFGLSDLSIAQKYKTYYNLNLQSSFSSKINNFNIGYGEQLQIKTALPVRFQTGLELDVKRVKLGVPVDIRNVNVISLKPLSAVGISLPVGVEIFKNNFGIGVSQQLFSFYLNSKYDNTKLSQEANLVASPRRFSGLFAKNPSLDSKVYLHYTITDSFTLKIGLDRSRLGLNFRTDDILKYRGIITDNAIYLSIRTNIEK